MNLSHLNLCLLLLLVLSGCIKDNLDDCPPEKADYNLTIKFALADSLGGKAFCDKIEDVDVFVFDENETFVCQHIVSKESLATFAGVSLKLDPAKYRIIFWANTGDFTACSSLTPGCLLKEAFLSNPQIAEASVNGDPLYYAPGDKPCKITIPEEGVVTKKVYFKPAHIKVHVFIKGFSDIEQTRKALPATVYLTDIPYQYNFNMDSFGACTVYHEVSHYETIEQEELIVARFNVPIFTKDAPIHILINKSSDNNTVTDIALADFIKENNITYDESKELIIPIFVEYKDASVTIGLPPWQGVPIEPEM